MCLRHKARWMDKIPGILPLVHKHGVGGCPRRGGRIHVHITHDIISGSQRMCMHEWRAFTVDRTPTLVTLSGVEERGWLGRNNGECTENGECSLHTGSPSNASAGLQDDDGRRLRCDVSAALAVAVRRIVCREMLNRETLQARVFLEFEFWPRFSDPRHIR